MHYCPECGQACYCHGDIDDTQVETPEYSDPRCTCPFDADGCGVERADHDEWPEDDEDDVVDDESSKRPGGAWGHDA